MSETTLSSLILSDPKKRPQVIRDLETLVEEEVSSKGGIEGLAIKGGFSVVKKVKPGIIPEALDHLLEPFLQRINPMFASYLATGKTDPKGFPAYLQQHGKDAANLLLGVTDDRARRAQNKTLKSAYEKLRPRAEKHVVDAIPGAARVLAKHL